MGSALITIMTLSCFFLTSTLAHAAPDPDFEIPASEIPSTPSAPPALARPAPSKPYICKREYVYRDKPYPCDSLTRQDGEGLRPVIQKAPAALYELNTYQDNKRRLHYAAYAGSSGLLLFLMPLIVPGIFSLFGKQAPLRSPLSHDSFAGLKSSGGRLASNILTFGGLGVLSFSGLYALTVFRTNEEHLAKSVELYNESLPSGSGEEIKLEFSTDVLRF